MARYHQQEHGWGEYDALGTDVGDLKRKIADLARDLAGERRQRQDIQVQLHNSLGRSQRLEQAWRQSQERLQRYARRVNKDEADGERRGTITSPRTSPAASPHARDSELTRIKARSRHLLAALKSCQAERDDLKTQVDADGKMKSYLDTQLSELEDETRRLARENSDLKQQVAADARTKEFLCKEWEDTKRVMQRLELQLDAIKAERDDIRVQAEADHRVKEYLSQQLDEAMTMRVRGGNGEGSSSGGGTGRQGAGGRYE